MLFSKEQIATIASFKKDDWLILADWYEDNGFTDLSFLLRKGIELPVKFSDVVFITESKHISRVLHRWQDFIWLNLFDRKSNFTHIVLEIAGNSDDASRNLIYVFDHNTPEDTIKENIALFVEDLKEHLKNNQNS